MTNPLRDLPSGFRVAVIIWAVANVVVLGLFLVGPGSYRTWFFDWGFFLETFAFWSLFFIKWNIWRER
jgi:hypothetical protein